MKSNRKKNTILYQVISGGVVRHNKKGYRRGDTFRAIEGSLSAPILLRVKPLQVSKDEEPPKDTKNPKKTPQEYPGIVENNGWYFVYDKDERQINIVGLNKAAAKDLLNEVKNA